MDTSCCFDFIRRAARPKVPPKPDVVCSSSEATRSECGDVDDKASSFGDTHDQEICSGSSLTPPDERSPKHSDDESDSKDSDRADSGIGISATIKTQPVVEAVWEDKPPTCQATELQEHEVEEVVELTSGRVTVAVAQVSRTDVEASEFEDCSIKPTEGKTIIEIFSCPDSTSSTNKSSSLDEVEDMNRKEAIAQGLFSASFIKVENNNEPTSLKLHPEPPLLVIT